MVREAKAKKRKVPKLRKIKTKDKIRNPKTRKLIKSTAGAYYDSKTKTVYSRRQRDKLVKGISYKPPVNRQYKARGKQLMYLRLRDDFIDKQKTKGKKITVGEAQRSKELKSIVDDLKLGAKLRKQGKKTEAQKVLLRALKKTTRRDGIADTVLVGESPKA